MATTHTVSTGAPGVTMPPVSWRFSELDADGMELSTIDPVRPDGAHLDTASRILAVISRYELRCRDQPLQTLPVANPKFIEQVGTRVAADEPVLMCLPAFPFKSPNTSSKVLGRLPDRAEQFALAHLNGLCSAIQDVYSPGAKLMIISDGLVYNDLLGVSDREVWAYGEALRALCAEKGFRHIEFSRLKDLVKLDLPDELNEVKYVCNATNFRYALLNRFGDSGFDVAAKIGQDEDVCMTYRGYIRFLSTDLEDVYPVGPQRTKTQYKRGVEYVAKQMLFRGDAFARAVKETFSDRLRLSIHPSSFENKISVSLLPTDTGFTTPWHCSIAFRLDGTITTGHRASFDADDKFELVHENGRPSFYREKSPLLSWSAHKEGIWCEPLYPAGYLIRPAGAPGSLSIQDIDAAKVRALAERVSPIILRGFSHTTDRDLFIEKARDFGTPLPWKFGLVLEVKDRGADTRGLNNVLSAEWMPYHYDGLFKTKKQVDENGVNQLVSLPPRFQLFTAVTKSPADTGFTLFASSALVFQNLPRDMPLDYLRRLTWTVSTGSFKAPVLKRLPLVVDHPVTGQPCLRFHEPWPRSKTQFEPTHVEIDNASTEHESSRVCEALRAVLLDRRVAYYHAWEKGDVLVSDNVLAMHTRSDFRAGCERELWRIHFD